MKKVIDDLRNLKLNKVLGHLNMKNSFVANFDDPYIKDVGVILLDCEIRKRHHKIYDGKEVTTVFGDLTLKIFVEDDKVVKVEPRYYFDFGLQKNDAYEILEVAAYFKALVDETRKLIK